MSAWRSPLLHLGFALILIAAAALFAPLFVDWNSYRAQFEDYGSKLTGRAVSIDGPIEARLFPWPALVLNQVRIANREGTVKANLMEAQRVEMGMSLAPLMSGQIEVESVTVERPVLALERLASGATSWTIEPDQSLAGLFDPDRVAVSEITIEEGTVFAGDHRRGDLARIDNVTGTLSAPALSGPWRMHATASHGGSPFEVNVTTGKLRSGESARIGVRLAPLQGAGMVYSFDGEVARREGKSVKGALKITPAPAARGKGDAEPRLRPFYVKADVEADYETVALTKIEATPAFSADPGNFITGAARVDLGSRVVVKTALASARLDVDQIIGRRGGDMALSTAVFDELGRLLVAAPEGLELHVDLSASSVVFGGETLDASRIKFELSPERLRIDEFTTAMPGQTRARFSGLLMFGEGEPQLSGDIAVDSVSVRDFVVWALPDHRRDIERVWNGIRGRLALQGRLDLAPQGVRLSDLRARLDEATLGGSVSIQRGSDAGLALRVDADRVDLDRYLTRGYGEWLGDSGLAASLIELIGEAVEFGDLQLTAQAGRLRFHGVEAQDIAIDLGANRNGVELRTVEIGRVGAARVDIAGLLRFPEEGIAGSLNALIDAENPRPLLRLLGVFGPDSEAEPAWARALGSLDLRLIAEASAEDRITTASMALTGSAGGANAAIEARFRGERANWQDGEIALTGEVDAPSSALLAAIVGLPLRRDADKPTRLEASLAGSLRGGLATSLETELLGAHGQFAGTVRQGRRSFEAQGRGAVLVEEAAEWFALLGVPDDSLSAAAQVFSAESEVRYDGRGLQLSALNGTAGGSAFSGELNVAFEPVRRVSGQLTTARLSLPWLLGAVLLPRDGTPHALSSHFAAAVPPVEANLTIAADRLELLRDMAFEASRLEVRLGRYDLALRGAGTGPGGGPATGRLDVQLDSRGVALDGAVELPVALGALLKAGDGSQVIEADGEVAIRFTGSGRSPAGVLTALRAEGTYELPGGVLKRVNPERFARDLAAAKQPSDIDGLFTGSLRSGDMAFVGGSGTLEFTDGVLQAKPLAILSEEMTGEARFMLEAASGEIDLSFTLALAELSDIPSFELAYAGPPRALETSTDAQSLKSYLSMKMLQESVQHLEELQRQERELIEQEERFRREQERLEQERQRQRRQEADQALDRKERELAARLRMEDRNAAEPDAELQAEPASEAAPGTAPPGAVVVLPLDPLPAAEDDVQPVSQSTPGALSDPVPLPMDKPARTPQASDNEMPPEPLQVPPDGRLGRIPEPVFSGPEILQPNLIAPQSGAAATVR